MRQFRATNDKAQFYSVQRPVALTTTTTMPTTTLRAQNKTNENSSLFFKKKQTGVGDVWLFVCVK
jgi:hypothetical protein